MGEVPAPQMDWLSTDLTSAMKMFKQRCALYFTVKGIKVEKQVNYILLFAGEQGLKIYNSWSLIQEEANQPDVVWEKFTTHVEPKTNFRIARFQLQKMKQEDESIDSYVSRVKLQAFKCKFRDEVEIQERVIEQLILGTRHPELQKDLLGKDKTLTLDQAIDIARSYEASIEHMKQLTLASAAPINSVHAINGVGKQKCMYCGGEHKSRPRNRCPAFGSTCSVCGKPNHWRIVCKSKLQSPGQPAQHRRSYSKQRTTTPAEKNQRYMKVQEVAVESDSVSDNELEGIDSEEYKKYLELKFNSILSKDTRDEVFTEITAIIHDKRIKAEVRVKIDTGAMGNTLPVRIFQKIWPEKVDETGLPKMKFKKSETTLTAYNGTRIQHFGSITLPCYHKEGNLQPTEFYIVNTEGPAILGLPSSRSLKLITLHCSIEAKEQINSIESLKAKYPEQFDKMGNFPGEYHITLRPDAHPVIHAPRKFAIHMKQDLEAELKNMEQSGVIAKVTAPTDWVNSMVVSRKSNGKLRICLDPKDLNKAIKRCHHKTPTVEEITYNLSGAQYFSKLDAKNGYWSVKLDEESSLLTTFNTPLGRYRYLRMPFGLVMSQDVFQRKMDQILEKCENCIGIADDVIVFGRTEHDHDRNLLQLMEIAKQFGLVFNSEKCEIKKSKVKFFGTIYDKHGAHPDPDKVAAISSLPPPKSTAQLQQFLGLVTYMSPYIPNLADHSAPLRDMLKKEARFQWNASHHQAFNRIKELICREVTLSYFDPNKETVIQVDASLRGIGAALIQDNKPVAFVSKSLTDVEQRYANIEREMLAVVVGCERFHTYVYGKPFVVESDHKPLEMIALKNLGAAPPRLQRMLLRLQNYDVRIRYKPGREMFLADGLSRLPTNKPQHVDLDISINFVYFGNDMLEQIRSGVSADAVLSQLRELIMIGWPDNIRNIPIQLRKYWPFRDELSVENGVITKGDRIIIPRELQKRILEKIHEGHQGMEKCKLRAKETVYWVDINSDIEKMVKECATCQKFQKSQQKESLLPQEIPTRPWQILGTDLFHLNGGTYLIVADYYSKFPIIRKMPEICTSQAVITATKDILAEHGIPERIISDNGPHFSSEKYKLFTECWSIKHVTSSPHYPQSNGFIERQIQTVKMTLKKALDGKTDVSMALLCLRATPIDHQLPSPASMLFNRQIRTNLPVIIRNHRYDKEQVQERLQERQEQQKQHYDKHAHDLPPLIPGEAVTVQNHTNKQWSPAVVRSVCPEPRSYIIESHNGSVFRRNRRDIRTVAQSEDHHESDPGRDSVEPCSQSMTATPDTYSEDMPCVPHETGPSPGTYPTKDKYVTRYGRTVKRTEKFGV